MLSDGRRELTLHPAPPAPMSGQPWPEVGDQQLAQAQQDLLDAREELTLTRLQLHQVQEELERCFLEGLAMRRQRDLLQEQRARLLDQLQRQQRLLRRVMVLAMRAMQRL